MGLGLLGALQGAGQSMTQFGNALFAEETERQRQADLQKIRDTDYKRARADQLTDQKTGRSYQLADQQTGFDRDDAVIAERNTREDTLRTDEREYQAGLLTDANELYDERYVRARDDENDTIVKVDTDDTGAIYGVTKGGEKRDVGNITVLNPVLGKAMDAYQGLQRQIQFENLNREDDPEVFETLDGYSTTINNAIKDASAKFGLGMSNEDAVNLGRSLFSGENEVDLDGTIISGQDLINARSEYGQRYPSLMELIQR